MLFQWWLSSSVPKVLSGALVAGAATVAGSVQAGRAVSGAVAAQAATASGTITTGRE